MRFAALAVTALATCAFALPSPFATVPTPSIHDRDLISSVLNLLNPSNLLVDLSAEGAAAFVGASLGLKADLIDVDAKAKLGLWLDGTDIDLDVSVKTALKGWCTGASAELDVDVVAEIALFAPCAAGIAAKGGLVVDVNGIASVGAAVGVILEADLQAELLAFLKANLDLDSEVAVGLHICANGGLVVALTADVKAALTAWLSSSECGLSAGLKAAIGLWLEAQVGVGAVALGTVSTAASISGSIGLTIDAAVDVEGILSATYITALKAWISAQVNLDADIKAALGICAGAKAAITLDIVAVEKLTAWLLSAECSLTAELKAAVLLWLHVRVTVAETISVLSAADIATLTTWIGGEIAADLSAVVKGVIGVAIAGEAVVNVSVDAIAELIGVLTGCVSGIDISLDIQIILGKWISGETCGCHSNEKRGLVMAARCRATLVVISV
ncbi:cell wall protein, putative [Talaromyces stipitatus ATCC 10500]|uniref:Cell wall protein, putative n=1 Tax=Talaromyces stipitatus (strain ATCC 10500 / CBS 375.48 / QM 6759 / NRRL 1006) TaxID=441959 RepID=B8MT48_TALSN|nr:cell wall protein, putative [Talaromyces stipitatus ATCC 10500]EED12251.1 cell wall protein, putative [Talaromyces stipitatus ATCC 10500]